MTEIEMHLDDAQRRTWHELTGPPFTGVILPRHGPPPRAQRQQRER
jgi:hypothetical protein